MTKRRGNYIFSPQQQEVIERQRRFHTKCRRWVPVLAASRGLLSIGFGAYFGSGAGKTSGNTVLGVGVMLSIGVAYLFGGLTFRRFARSQLLLKVVAVSEFAFRVLSFILAGGRGSSLGLMWVIAIWMGVSGDGMAPAQQSQATDSKGSR